MTDDKPKFCPIANIGKMEFTTKCIRGECEWWYDNECCVATQAKSTYDLAYYEGQKIREE